MNFFRNPEQNTEDKLYSPAFVEWGVNMQLKDLDMPKFTTAPTEIYRSLNASQQTVRNC